MDGGIYPTRERWKNWKREGAEREREGEAILKFRSSGYELGLPPGSVVKGKWTSAYCPSGKVECHVLSLDRIASKKERVRPTDKLTLLSPYW